MNPHNPDPGPKGPVVTRISWLAAFLTLVSTRKVAMCSNTASPTIAAQSGAKMLPRIDVFLWLAVTVPTKTDFAKCNRASMISDSVIPMRGDAQLHANVDSAETAQ